MPVSAALGQAAGEALNRKFFTLLSLGRIGFEGSFQQSVELAVKYGFEGVDPDPDYFAKLSDDEMKKVLDDLAAKHLRLGAGGLPVEFRQDDQTFSDGLKNLPAVAKVLQRAGVKSISTWIMPFSNDLNYLQNFRQHACRLRECAKVLLDHDQLLGLEYVGPKTLLHEGTFPFLHTLCEAKELEVAIGTHNLGFQLDSFHWFNAQETQADILSLRPRDVLTVDLNDARKVPLDQQEDSKRELPAASGVIPVKIFLQGLAIIGYAGPIQAEPFNAHLRSLPIEQACAETAAAMRKAFQVAELQS
jgi:sugar phosphate isomerase/epimerase